MEAGEPDNEAGLSWIEEDDAIDRILGNVLEPLARADSKEEKPRKEPERDSAAREYDVSGAPPDIPSNCGSRPEPGRLRGQW